MVVVGFIVGWVYDCQVDKGLCVELVKQFGVLLVLGLIVGESIIGVVIVVIVVFVDKFGLCKDGLFVLVGFGFVDYVVWLGGGVFVIVVFVLYCWVGWMGWVGV